MNPRGDELVKVDWDASVQVLKADTAELVAEQPEHMDWITSLAWSADGSQITSASSDGLLRIWDVTTGELLKVPSGQMEPGPITAENPDGTRSASAGNDGVTITDTAASAVIAFLPGPSNTVSWSPDGTRLAVALRNGTIKIWGEE